MVLAGESLRRKNYLMLGIDQSLGVASLNDAMRGRYLDRFVIDDNALDLFAIATQLGLVLRIF